jgi:hypothetical protein
VKQRSFRRGTPGWYRVMTDDQLQTSLRGLQQGSREWSIVKRVIDDRAAERREQRNVRLKVAALMLAAVAAVAAVIVLR